MIKQSTERSKVWAKKGSERHSLGGVRAQGPNPRLGISVSAFGALMWKLGRQQ